MNTAFNSHRPTHSSPRIPCSRARQHAGNSENSARLLQLIQNRRLLSLDSFVENESLDFPALRTLARVPVQQPAAYLRGDRFSRLLAHVAIERLGGAGREHPADRQVGDKEPDQNGELHNCQTDKVDEIELMPGEPGP